MQTPPQCPHVGRNPNHPTPPHPLPQTHMTWAPVQITNSCGPCPAPVSRPPASPSVGLMQQESLLSVAVVPVTLGTTPSSAIPCHSHRPPWCCLSAPYGTNGLSCPLSRQPEAASGYLAAPAAGMGPASPCSNQLRPSAYLCLAVARSPFTYPGLNCEASVAASGTLVGCLSQRPSNRHTLHAHTLPAARTPPAHGLLLHPRHKLYIGHSL